MAPGPEFEPEQEWRWCHGFVLGSPPEDDEEPAVELTALANALYSDLNRGDRRVATLCAEALVRHLASIDLVPVLSDLPFLCGRLRLQGECYQCIARLLEAVPEPDATTWTNLGAVLCDNLQQPAPAMRCFEHAISQDPDLPQPRQGIWIAGRDALAQAISMNRCDLVTSIHPRVEALGDVQEAHHGFWSYAGICFERLDETAMARECYEAASQLHPECAEAGSGLARLDGRPPQYGDLATHLARLGDQLGYMGLDEEPDDYRFWD